MPLVPRELSERKDYHMKSGNLGFRDTCSSDCDAWTTNINEIKILRALQGPDLIQVRIMGSPRGRLVNPPF
jgi:hypothetical protein